MHWSPLWSASCKISPPPRRRPGAHCRPLDPASLSLFPWKERRSNCAAASLRFQTDGLKKNEKNAATPLDYPRAFIEGILKDKQASRFSVPVGHHRVQVRRDFMKSECWDLTSALGSAEFECGYHRARPSRRMKIARLVAIAVCLGSVVVLPALGLPFWSVYVLAGIGVLALGFLWWQS